MAEGQGFSDRTQETPGPEASTSLIPRMLLEALGLARKNSWRDQTQQLSIEIGKVY